MSTPLNPPSDVPAPSAPVSVAARTPLSTPMGEPDVAWSPRPLPETGTDVLYYWRLIRARYRLVLAAALLGGAVATVVSVRQPRLYVAQATIEFKRAAPPGSELDIGTGDFAISPELAQRLLTTKLLAARVVTTQRQRGQQWFDPPPQEAAPPSLLQVAWGHGYTLASASLGVLRRLLGPPAHPGDAAPSDTQPRTWDGVDLGSIGRYYGHIAIRPVRGTSLTDVIVTHPDPDIATQVANDHVRAFIEMDLETKVASLSDADTLFGQQLKEVRGQLEVSRKALTDFQLQHGILTLPADSSTLTRESLQQLNKLLIEAQGERIVAEAAYRNAASQTADQLAETLPDKALEAGRAEILRQTAHYQASLQDYGPNHPDMIALRAGLDSLRDRLRSEAGQTRDRLGAIFEAAQVKETELRNNLEALGRAASREDRELVQLSILEREVESNKQLYTNLLDRAKESELRLVAFRWTNASVVDEAIRPTVPSYPNTRRSLTFGLLLGLAVGVGACVLIERLDTTLHTPDDLMGVLGLPALGVVPDFRKLPTGSAPVTQVEPAMIPDLRRELVTLLDPASLVSEAYRSVRTNLMFSSAGGPPRAILVTSSQPSEGKTVTVINLGVTLALSGARVLVIDADLRKPGCHAALRVPREPGLTNLLTGQASREAVVTRSPLSPKVPLAQEGYGLYVLPAGALPPNPAELVGSRVMTQLLEELRQEFDFILIDSPPLLPVTDSVILATKADAVVLVVKEAEWDAAVVRKALGQLDAVRAHSIGAVLNCVDLSRGGRPGHYYRYYYGYHGYYGRGGAQDVAA